MDMKCGKSRFKRWYDRQKMNPVDYERFKERRRVYYERSKARRLHYSEEVKAVMRERNKLRKRMQRRRISEKQKNLSAQALSHSTECNANMNVDLRQGSTLPGFQLALTENEHTHTECVAFGDPEMLIEEIPVSEDEEQQLNQTPTFVQESPFSMWTLKANNTGHERDDIHLHSSKQEEIKMESTRYHRLRYSGQQPVTLLCSPASCVSAQLTSPREAPTVMHSASSSFSGCVKIASLLKFQPERTMDSESATMRELQLQNLISDLQRSVITMFRGREMYRRKWMLEKAKRICLATKQQKLHR